MTVLDPALHESLRALKLTGMLQTLDAHVAQARTGQLGHLDFLQVLCEDEIARRETSAQTRRLRLARFEEQATMETFDFTAKVEATWGIYQRMIGAYREPDETADGPKQRQCL